MTFKFFLSSNQIYSPSRCDTCRPPPWQCGRSQSWQCIRTICQSWQCWQCVGRTWQCIWRTLAWQCGCSQSWQCMGTPVQWTSYVNQLSGPLSPKYPNSMGKGDLTRLCYYSVRVIILSVNTRFAEGHSWKWDTSDKRPLSALMVVWLDGQLGILSQFVFPQTTTISAL